MEIKGFSNKIAEADKKAAEKKKVAVLHKKELQDELEPMMTIGKSELNSYLDRHGYKLVADTDGSVKWAIWRVI